MNATTDEHAFSLELKRNALKRATISSEDENHVLVEGNLGKLENLCMVEKSLLEIHGCNGVLRIDLKYEELEEIPSKTANKIK